MPRPVFTNKQRIETPFLVLVEQYPPIVEAQRKARMAELEALKKHGLSPGPETWNELVEANASAIRFSYDDEWTSYVAVASESEIGLELGLVVGPVDGGFLWGTKRAAQETLTSKTKIHFEAVLGTATPRLTNAIMAELTGTSGMNEREVVSRAAGALYEALRPNSGAPEGGGDDTPGGTA